jgi:PAS domain S-box-containing protein
VCVKAPDIPPNEPERLLALREYEVVDTPAEAGFDGLTALAAELLGVPIALVSIVDSDRQWFKSRYGLSAPETPRDVSFCGHVVAGEAALVVADALADPRFSDNPLVTGEPRVRFYAGMPLRTRDGFVLGTLCAIDHVPREITARQRNALALLASQVVALLELRRSERLLRAESAALEVHRRFFVLSLDLLCTTDDTMRFGELNPSWERVLGWTPEELRAGPFLDFVHPDDVEQTRREASRLMRDSSTTVNFENRYRHRDGRWIPLSWTAAVGNGVIFATARDISAYREKERALLARDAELEASEGRLRALFDGMVEGVVLQDRTGAIIASNPAAGLILGLSLDQLKGLTSIDPRWRAVHEDGSPFPGDTHPAMVTLRTAEPLTNVIMGVHKPSGELTWISINARPLIHAGETAAYAAFTTFRDISEQRAAAALAGRLARQDRLVTTGTLAAGVGHEINNPLSYVLGNIDFTVERLRAMDGASPSARLAELLEALGEAREGADRVRKIVRGLRALAREDGPPVPTDVHAAIEIGTNMAMHELRQRATVVTELPAVPLVLADESRLTQVLVNLIVNAAQAFQANDPTANRVTVRSSASADSVTISVEDNGPGIPADVLPRIFDPFFTTKPVGQGTGLGLSISHTIVTGLGGEILCETAVGKGTTFRVVLPVAAGGEVSGAADPVNRPLPRGRILVVDDEDGVLRSMSRLLSSEHDVVAIGDSREARARLASGDKFDVVFCDLMMPHLSGVELYRWARDRDPALADRFVFITGGVPREDTAAFLSEIPNERLEKPFSTQNLRGVTRRYVGAGGGPGSRS